MAVDKKSDHVGNHGGRYTDNDGMTKQFTYIDHDVKPMLAPPVSKQEITDAKQWLKEYRPRLIQQILDIPAVFCAEVYDDFLLRGDRKGVVWNEQMLRDEGIDLNKLTSIHTLANNKMTLVKQGIAL